MLVAQPRPNEAGDLQALRGLHVLDTSREAQFDALVDAAALACETPIAVISLIDTDRQWFKACLGLPGVSETPRDVAFCAHAVLEDDLMEVSDAHADDRFRNNPLVTGDPCIRFYAGMPLKLKNGACVGTLCVIDRVAKQLTERQKQMLRKLALVAAHALENHGADRRVAELEAVNRRLYDASPAMLYSIDPQGVVLAASDMLLAKLGYNRDEVVGKPGADFLTPESREKALLHTLPELARTGYTNDVEYRIVTKSGDVRVVAVSARMEFDQAGRALRSLSVMQDITDVVESRNKIAAARRQNDALLGVLNEHAIVSIADRRGVITHVNDNFCKVSGYERDELIGQNHRIVKSGHHPDGFWPDMWRTLAAKRSWKGEVCNRTKTGELYWVDSIIAPMLDGDGDGEVVYYISIRYDITQRKQAAAALEASYHRLDLACEAAGIGVWTCVPATGAMQWDGRMWHLFDFEGDARPPAEHAWHMRVHKEDGGRVSDWMSSVPASARTAVDFRILAADGSVRYMRAFAGFAHGDTSRQHGIFGICMDQTDVVEQEMKLKAALADAERAARARSQFLANMSHEIRTPMNAVIGLGYLLRKTHLNADQAALLDKIDKAGKALMAVINDILDVTRIEAGELPIEALPFLLSDVMGGLDAIIRPLAQAKGLDIHMGREASIQDCWVGDAARLRQILINLLSNAVKFTPAGRVAMDVRVVSRSADVCRLRFEVLDTGVGIDASVLPRLFQPFSQADASTTRRYGGSGLGLAIVKQLAALMGGDVGVSTVAHQGSTFWVELPFGLGSDSAHTALGDTARHEPEGALLKGVRVLAVDDSGLNLEVLRRTLEVEGATVATAMNGQEALDVLVALPDGFDIVLMDAQMPVLDGYDATRRIREGLCLTRLPIIALTAGSLSSEQARAREVGMNGFIPKPFDPRQLVDGIRGWVGLAPVGALGDDALEGGVQLAIEGWPNVDGIDSADVCRRLGGQVDLFIDMVQKLLDDFQDIESEGAFADVHPAEVAVTSMANRMHTLKGSAGTLGAKALAQAAARAEALLRSHLGDLPQPLGDVMVPVRDALSALRASFGAADPRRSRAEPGLESEALDLAPVIPPLKELIDLLEQGDMQACDLHKHLKPALRQIMTTDAQARLQHSMNELRFVDAARQLKEVVSRTPPADQG